MIYWQPDSLAVRTIRLRIVCAWELGASLGHLARVTALARALSAAGHEVTVVVRDLGGSGAFLRDIPCHLQQAPLFHGRLSLQRPQACLADTLLLAGYAAADSLWPLWQGWCTVLRQSQAELLVADHAPTALMAARSLNLPCIPAGNGFTLPAFGASLADWRPLKWEDDLVARQEQQVVGVINSLLVTGRQLARLSDLYSGCGTVITSFPHIDPYAGQRRNVQYCVDNPQTLTRRAVFSSAARKRICAYLVPGFAKFAELCEALAASGADVTLLCPGAGAGPWDRLEGEHFRIERTPLDLAALLNACDLFVGHGALGTLTQCMRLGKPMLLLPLHMEQLHNAVQAQKLGIAHVSPILETTQAYTQTLSTALQDSSAALKARAFADAHHQHYRQTFADTLVQLVATSRSQMCI
jgi:hypothetical protein